LGTFPFSASRNSIKIWKSKAGHYLMIPWVLGRCLLRMTFDSMISVFWHLPEISR
jgi:hypothetical protein